MLCGNCALIVDLTEWLTNLPYIVVVPKLGRMRRHVLPSVSLNSQRLPITPLMSFCEGVAGVPKQALVQDARHPDALSRS
jgi:hypothetical protein